MKIQKSYFVKILFALTFCLAVVFCVSITIKSQTAKASSSNGTILSSAGQAWAWGDNIGYINFGCSNCGVAISDSGGIGVVTGYAWSGQYGWINLNPNFGGMYISPSGAVYGNIWSEGVGWIDLGNTTTPSGITVSSAGVFSGISSNAANLSGGKLNFNCTLASAAVCTAEHVGVTTDYIPISLRTTPTPTPASGGGGGGGGVIITPTPTVSPTPTATTKTPVGYEDLRGQAKLAAFNYKIGEITADGMVVGSLDEAKRPQKKQVTYRFRSDINDNLKVDLPDFNLLMVNWGKKEGDATQKTAPDKNISDINLDTKIDILDFNMLMVYWNMDIHSLVGPNI